MEKDKKIQGVGDVVAVALEKTGLSKIAPKNCGACKRRQMFLNKKFPIK